MNTLKRSGILALLLAAQPGTADQAYTWTDSAGVTHFSESLPGAVAREARRIDLPPAPVTPTLPPERYRSISNQATRLQADRLKREQQRAKRRQIGAERRQQAREQEEQAYPDYPVNNFYLYYPYPYGYPPHHRRHHRPHDDYPHRPRYAPARPWFQPGKTLTQKRNAEALRNHPRHW